MTKLNNTANYHSKEYFFRPQRYKNILIFKRTDLSACAAPDSVKQQGSGQLFQLFGIYQLISGQYFRMQDSNHIRK